MSLLQSISLFFGVMALVIAYHCYKYVRQEQDHWGRFLSRKEKLTRALKALDMVSDIYRTHLVTGERLCNVFSLKFGFHIDIKYQRCICIQLAELYSDNLITKGTERFLTDWISGMLGGSPTTFESWLRNQGAITQAEYRILTDQAPEPGDYYDLATSLMLKQKMVEHRRKWVNSLRQELRNEIDLCS